MKYLYVFWIEIVVCLGNTESVISSQLGDGDPCRFVLNDRFVQSPSCF